MNVSMVILTFKYIDHSERIYFTKHYKNEKTTINNHCDINYSAVL